MLSFIFATAKTQRLELSQIAYCKEQWLWACTLGNNIHLPTPPPPNPVPTERTPRAASYRQSWKNSVLTEVMRVFFLLYLPPTKPDTHSVCDIIPSKCSSRPGEVRLEVILGLEWLLRKEAVCKGGCGLCSITFWLKFCSCL